MGPFFYRRQDFGSIQNISLLHKQLFPATLLSVLLKLLVIANSSHLVIFKGEFY
jgi:hypothetical protein